MGKLKAVAELFEGRHFDRKVIILCVAGIFASSSVCATWWRWRAALASHSCNYPFLTNGQSPLSIGRNASSPGIVRTSL
jgi:hypothetical protein